MKKFFAILVFFILFTSIFCWTAENQLFENFKIQNQKVYASSDEENLASLNLLETSKKIEAHNKLFKDGLKTYELGLWENSDLSEDQVNKLLNGFITLVLRKKQALSLIIGNFTLPLSLNFTASGAVTAVRSQGNCGES